MNVEVCKIKCKIKSVKVKVQKKKCAGKSVTVKLVNQKLECLSVRDQTGPDACFQHVARLKK